jgi:hypothetical protein
MVAVAVLIPGVLGFVTLRELRDRPNLLTPRWHVTVVTVAVARVGILIVLAGR